MVERLSAGDLSVSELAEPLTMSLPAVLQHVRVLEASGLVHSRKTGRVRTCSLDRALFTRAESWFLQRRTEWNDRLDRLGEHLARDDDHGGREGHEHDDKENRR
ncbi:ArsR/SmtB family transcription factor [Humibacter ginsenosidimutans]|nr:helix-turn-helix domain-containing protein [Humibacter ginsenosidimutans]